MNEHPGEMTHLDLRQSVAKCVQTKPTQHDCPRVHFGKGQGDIYKQTVGATNEPLVPWPCVVMVIQRSDGIAIIFIWCE